MDCKLFATRYATAGFPHLLAPIVQTLHIIWHAIPFAQAIFTRTIAPAFIITALVPKGGVFRDSKVKAPIVVGITTDSLEVVLILKGIIGAGKFYERGIAAATRGFGLLGCRVAWSWDSMIPG